jgi:hypothetical protein
VVSLPRCLDLWKQIIDFEEPRIGMISGKGLPRGSMARRQLTRNIEGPWFQLPREVRGTLGKLPSKHTENV